MIFVCQVKFYYELSQILKNIMDKGSLAPGIDLPKA